MDSISNGDINGVLVVRDHNRQTLVAETFFSEEEGLTKLTSWVDTMILREKGGNMGTTVDYYELPDMSIVEGRSDRQIGLLMDGLKPDEHISVIGAAFTQRQGGNPYSEDSIRSTIEADPERFSRFVNRSSPLLGVLNRPVEVNASEGEFCHAERVFELKHGFSFTGGDYIRDNKDVAYIFRQLGQKAVENSFCFLQKGDKNYILHLGIGGLAATAIDMTALLTATRRLQAEKVWFVHNHPSGRVFASREDRAIWDKLHQALGDVMQEGIIINTTSGKYGVFTNYYNEVQKIEGPQLDEAEREIPVLAFDRTVFHDTDISYKDRQFTSPQDVAEFVSTQRLGKRDSMSFLALDTSLQVKGNFHLPDNRFGEWNDKLSYIADVCLKTGSSRVFIYAGKSDGKIMDVELPSMLLKRFDTMTAGTAQLLDIVLYDRAGEDLAYYSYHEEGRLAEKEAAYDKPAFDHIDVIPVKGGRGMIRVSRDGEMQPAEMVSMADMKLLQEGQLDKVQLADKYCRHLLEEENDRTKALKR